MILDKIVENKELELLNDKRIIPLKEMILLSKEKNPRNFEEALKNKPFSVIGEIKKASPSKGVFLDNFNIEKISKIYGESRVNAISVLTEKNFFQGDPLYIEKVKSITNKPVLRKDFIIDEYQIYQSKFIGADGILLIASILKEKLPYFYSLSESIGLHPLIEVHNEEELIIALDSGSNIIGINNRDLSTFKEDISVTKRLIPLIPKGKIIISESSIKSPEDMNYLLKFGVNGFLIGETFIRNIENPSFINSFIEKARN